MVLTPIKKQRMNMNFKQAKEFLEIELCSPAILETDEKETKHKLIIALKVFVSNNLKIKQNFEYHLLL